jgi:hypothetical protein
MKVSTSEERQIAGILTTEYNVRKAAQLARARRDPLLAPHGFFRALKHGDSKHALEFLEKFGPLTMTSDQRSLANHNITVDLNTFWREHRRFVLTVSLYESRDSRESLDQAWRELHAHVDEFNTGAVFPYGALPTNILAGEGFQDWQRPWDWADSFKGWLSGTTQRDLHDHALDVVHRELNNHSVGRQLWWLRDVKPGRRDRFVPFTRTDSLRSMVWELFGLDTAGVMWRRCLGCGRFFYPKRRDQFYCTPREQALASKRDYARRARARVRAASRSLRKKGA